MGYNITLIGRNKMKKFKVINPDHTQFKVGEVVAKCYIQKFKALGLFYYYSFSSGIIQAMYPEQVEEIK